jgi:hypothetical protein
MAIDAANAIVRTIPAFANRAAELPNLIIVFCPNFPRGRLVLPPHRATLFRSKHCGVFRFVQDIVKKASLAVLLNYT